MICLKCRRNVQPEMPFATCPECWSALPAEKLSCGDPLSRAITHRKSFKLALDMGMIEGHLSFMESHFRLVENIDHAKDFHYPAMRERLASWLYDEEYPEIGLAGVTEIVLLVSAIGWFTIYAIYRYSGGG